MVGGGLVGGGGWSEGSGGTCQKKILDLVKYPLSFSLSHFSVIFEFFFFFFGVRIGNLYAT